MQFIYKNNGRNYPEFDCYGLIAYLYKKDFGIDLVDFNYINSNDTTNSLIFHREMNSKSWERVDAQKGTIVALRVNGRASHCGYMVSDNEFVHIMQNVGFSRVNINNPKWKNRIIGYYKYKGKND